MMRPTDCICFPRDDLILSLSNDILQLRKTMEQQQRTITEQNDLIEEAQHIIEGLTVLLKKGSDDRRMSAMLLRSSWKRAIRRILPFRSNFSRPKPLLNRWWDCLTSVTRRRSSRVNSREFSFLHLRLLLSNPLLFHLLSNPLPLLQKYGKKTRHAAI